ncbi:MAG: DUF3341 domain-containing protein [Chthoniobacterales bacterium]|nr:DUF3341 domain-containing protein [Chthoniobacterales bacterium]
MSEDWVYGLVAEFESDAQLMRAAEETYAKGYRKIDGFTPFPIEGLGKALGKSNRIPLLVLLAGILGGCSAYFMEWFANVVSYPLNIGGRPLHSWPAFIPITFELTVLGAALTAFFSVFVLSGLPKPYHPMFNLPEFERASQDRFFLCIETVDPQFDPVRTRLFLETLRPLMVKEVAK